MTPPTRSPPGRRHRRRPADVGGVALRATVRGAARTRHRRGAPTRRESGERVTLRFFRNPAPAPAFTVRDLDGTRAVVRVAARQGRHRQLLGDLVRPLPRRDSGSGRAAGEISRPCCVVIGISEDEAPPEVVRRVRRQAQGQLSDRDDDAGAREDVPGHQRAADLVHPRSRVAHRAEARRHADGAHHRVRDARARRACRSTRRSKKSIRRRG